MPTRRAVVLTGSSEVLSAVEALYSGVRVRAIACLGSIRAPGAGTFVVIDPGAVKPCCLRVLRCWGRTRRRRQVVYLALPAPPDVLLMLGALHPAGVRTLDGAGDGATRADPPAPGRAAWNDRRRLIDCAPRDARQRLFLELAAGSAGFGRPEGEIAEALGVGTRHLSRLVLGWFGYTPKVVLDVFRLDRVVREVGSSGRGLEAIARTFGYAGRRALTRQCRAFTGLPPSAFRRMASGGSPGTSEDGPSVSETGGFRPSADGRIDVRSGGNLSTDQETPEDA